MHGLYSNALTVPNRGMLRDKRVLKNRIFNQFTSGILYFFRSPVRDYFQPLIIFVVNETKSGQPNKRLIH